MMGSIVLVGCGNIGNEYAKIIDKLGSRISLAIGRKESNRQKELSENYNCEFSSDVSDLFFKKIKYDGIIISIPPEEDLGWLNKVPPTNILIEKPGKLKSYELKKLSNFKHNIFIAYNRKFYNSVSQLKSFVESQKGPCFVRVNIPESLNSIHDSKNKQKPYNLIYNSCHIFSILRYVFGDLKFEKTFQTEQLFINGSAELHSFKKCCHFINCSIHMGEYSNTSIYVKGDERSFLLKPIEESSIYDGLEIIYDKNSSSKKYNPKVSQKNYSTCEHGFKPGFYNQTKAFLDYCINGKEDHQLTRLSEGCKILKEIEYFLQDN